MNFSELRYVKKNQLFAHFFLLDCDLLKDKLI